MLSRSIIFTCALAVAGCPGNSPSYATGGGGGDGVGGEPTTTGPSTGGAGATGAGDAGGKGGEGAGGKGGGGGGEAGAGGCGPLDTVENCGECGHSCVQEDPVISTSCTAEGRCVPVCKDGWTSLVDPTFEEGGDNGCEIAKRRVFVTKVPVPIGDLEGVTSGDERCAAAAAFAGLEGTWIAWLSTGESAAIDRFDVMEPVAYFRLDDALVATSLDALTSADQVELFAPIDVDEDVFPIMLNTIPVWTGTAADGTATGIDCKGWVGNGLDVNAMATVGDAKKKDGRWTEDNSEHICAQLARLYCFEQDPPPP